MGPRFCTFPEPDHNFQKGSIGLFTRFRISPETRVKKSSSPSFCTFPWKGRNFKTKDYFMGPAFLTVLGTRKGPEIYGRGSGAKFFVPHTDVVNISWMGS